MERYQHTAGVTAMHGPPPLFNTPQGGVVVTDAPLLSLWSAAPARTSSSLVEQFAGDASLSGIVEEALACLCGAGLLEQPRSSNAEHEDAPDRGPRVSAIVIVSSPGELEWLNASLASLAAARYAPLDAIVVDNASGAPVAEAVDAHTIESRVLDLDRRVNLARACNEAISAARGEYFLLMNPDVKVHPAAVAHLVARAVRVEEQSRVAAVVPKTRFWRAPSFLNGIGNRICRDNWGTDNGIGHLDLGQFDGWQSVPSASLSIMLVSRRAWDDVGPFDDRFPAYYEDAEWSYRARMLGWDILAEPKAEAFHIFGGFWDAPEDGGLSARKLKTAVEGRLRFTLLLPGSQLLVDLLCRYARQDAGNILRYTRAGRQALAAGCWSGWRSVLATAPSTWSRRRQLQTRRVIDDAALFPPESEMPACLTERNAPLLTSEVIRREYVPLLKARRASAAPGPRPGSALAVPGRRSAYTTSPIRG
jgi:GT2 family glycosyltransferase